MTCFRLFITLLFFFLQFTRTAAQVPLFSEAPLGHHSNLQFFSIARTANGFLYTGTNQGLFRYDGSVLEKVAGNDSGTVGAVTALYAGDEGRLWCGFRDGKIAVLENNRLNTLALQGARPTKQVTSIMQGPDDKVWFGTNGEGIFVLDGSVLEQLTDSHGLSDNYVHCLIRDPVSGAIIAGTDRGLSFCSLYGGRKEFKNLSMEEGLPDNIVTDLIADGNNVIAGTQDKGICLLEPKSAVITVPPLSKDWSFGQVNKLLVMETELWVATQEHGLLILNREDLRLLSSFRKIDDTGYPKIYDFTADKEGNVWIAASEALIRSSGNRVRKLELPGLSSLTFVHAILADSRNNYWFSPDQELVKAWKDKDGIFQTQKFTVTPPEKLIDIVTLYEDPYGYLWIGTMGAGVFKLHIPTGRLRKVTEEPALLQASILSISGKNAKVWIGGFGGVHCCRTDASGSVAFEKNAVTDSLTMEYVYAILVDSKNQVWIGSDGRGVFRYDGNALKNLQGESGTNAYTVYSIAEDPSGKIWINTQDEGLFSFNGSAFVRSGDIPAPGELTVSSMAFDKAGNFFLAHRDGIDILNPESRTRRTIRGDEYLKGLNPDINAITLDRDGNLLVGTEKMILVVPHVGMDLPAQPETFLEKKLVFGAEPAAGDSDYTHEENNFTFGYIGLSYSNPGLVRYRYKLEGYSEWTFTNDREVNFPKLEPGRYVFRVQSALDDRFVNAKEASFAFVINPPFWKRLWFRALLALAVLLLLYGFIIWRENRLRKLDRLQKEKIIFQFETLKSQVNPHFLFNSFNTLISVIEENPKAAIGYVEKMSEFFRSIVSHRDDELISLKDELDLLDNYFYLQKKRYGKNLGMEIKVTNEDQNQYQVPPLTLQLLAENAVKHNAVSKETPLHIRIFTDGGKLAVENNINPKLRAETSSGMGLQNITNRFRLLTSEAVDISNDGKLFIVKLPLLRK